MRIKQGFITERINFIKKLTLTAKAEEQPPVEGEDTKPTEPTTPVEGSPSTPTINYEDLIAQARKQEKAKLYPQIEKLEKENKALVEKNNANLLVIGEKESEITTLNKTIADLKASSNKGASEVEKELNKRIAELEKELTDIKADTVSREEIENEIKAEYEVKLFREQKLREVGDSIIPELVSGTTKEEIEASIKVAQDRFKEIQDKIMGSVIVPVSNTSVSSFQKANVSLDDIAKLDPRSPEYAQLRAKLGVR